MDEKVLNYDITNLVKQHTCVNYLASWFEAPVNPRKIHLLLKTFYFFVFFCSGVAFAQPNKTTKSAPNAIGSAGNQATVSNVTYMWTVGEAIVFTGLNQPGFVTQGFHQPMICKAFPTVVALNQTSCLLPYTLNATAGFDKYTWKWGKSTIANASGDAYFPIADGIYTATVGDSTGCVLTAASIAVDLSSKNIIPGVTAYGSADKDTLLESTIAVTYQWYVITPSDNLHRAIIGQINRNYKPIYNGIYYVRTNTEEHCLAYSSYYVVNNASFDPISKYDFEQSDTSINLIKKSNLLVNRLTVFPIPSKDKINVVYESASRNTVMFNIYDSKGILVDTRRLSDADGRFNYVYESIGLPTGRYLLKVFDGDRESDKGLIFE